MNDETTRGTVHQVHIRPTTWEFLLEGTDLQPTLLDPAYLHNRGYPEVTGETSPADVLQRVAAYPGPILVDLGILSRADLLARTAVELDDEVLYLITEKAAIELASGQSQIHLRVLDDSIERLVGRQAIVQALQGDVFDQLEQ